MTAEKGGMRPASPYAIRNVRMFIAFKFLFNARFYYPVFTILFLDFGLTVSQFALLNAVWAATIVIMEVPSGALADIWGRRNLLILAAVLMIFEMAVLCLAPRGHLQVLFGLFVINRILSGVAEAAASGADEALAFDALRQAGCEDLWGRVLSTQMRLQSVAFIMAMSIGAAVYDPLFMQRVADFMGLEITFNRDITIRIPLILTFIMACLTLAATLRMKDDRRVDPLCRPDDRCGVSAVGIWRQTLDAGKWIMLTPFALVIISAGFLFDSIIRMVITLNSQYYRVIALPEAVFGLIGACVAGMGLFLPRIALKMSEKYTPRFNLGVVAAMTICGLYGMSRFIPVTGLLPAIVLFSAMYLNGFFVSNYLNRITASQRRATVLSFKGLSFNLLYGALGILYSILLAVLRPQTMAQHADLGPLAVENMVFIRSFPWFLWAFIAGLAIFVVFASFQLKSLDTHRRVILEKDQRDDMHQ